MRSELVARIIVQSRERSIRDPYSGVYVYVLFTIIKVFANETRRPWIRIFPTPPKYSSGFEREREMSERQIINE